jgi:hypothetical protein
MQKSPGHGKLAMGVHPAQKRPVKPVGEFLPLLFGANHIVIFQIIAACGPGSTGTVTDREGNVYQTIEIGDQWCMAENLRVTI